MGSDANRLGRKCSTFSGFALNLWKHIFQSESPQKGAGKLVPLENCGEVSKTCLRSFVYDFLLICPLRKWLKDVEPVLMFSWCLTLFEGFCRGCSWFLSWQDAHLHQHLRRTGAASDRPSVRIQHQPPRIRQEKEHKDNQARKKQYKVFKIKRLPSVSVATPADPRGGKNHCAHFGAVNTF